MLNQLLAPSGWILDLVFFLILILGTALGAYRGFVAGICKLAGKVFSIVFAVMFCVSFANFLELCFHMTTGISTGLAGAIAKNETYALGLSADIAGAEIGATLKEMGVGAIPRWLISRSFASVESIPAGTTAAMLISSVLAKWISIVIAFIALIIILRLGVFLIVKIFGAIRDKAAPVRIADQALGAILGFAKAALLVFVLLMLCDWLPIQALHSFIESSNIVGKIFVSNWFQSATSYAISGEWFNDYIKKLL